MRVRQKVLISIIVILLFCSSVFAARRSTDPMTTITDVRALGMGRAGLATLGNSNALFANPAGLTKIKTMGGSIFSTKLMNEFNYFGINGAMKTSYGWLAAGYGSMSIDAIPETFRYEQGDGTRTYKLSEFSAGSNIMSVGYATKFEFLADMSVGVSLKRATDYIEAADDSHFDSSSLVGYGADAGIMVPLSFFGRDFTLGAAMLNVMAPTFKDDSENAETVEEESAYASNMRVGLSTELDLWSQNFILAADYDILGVHAGAEWLGPEGFSLRGGFDVDNFTMGLGLKVFSITGFDNKPHTIAIDYAYKFYNEPLENTNFIGFSYLGVSQTERPSIMKPVSGTKVTVPTISVEGMAGKGDQVTLYVNDIPRKVMKASDSNSIWETDGVFLNDGKNVLTVQSEQLEFAASEFSEPIVVYADLTPVGLKTFLEMKGNSIIIKAQATKKLARVATMLPTGKTLALTYDTEHELWVGTWDVPLQFMDKKVSLQTRGVDENGKKTETKENETTVKAIKYPQDKTVVANDFLSVRGLVPIDAKAILVAGNPVEIQEDGSFETTVDLPELGKQLVKVEVVDSAGVTKTSTLRIVRKAAPADVSKDSFAYSAISDLLTLGVVQVDEQNNFLPKEQITRGELAVLIAKLKGLKAEQVQAYNDVPAGSPAAGAISAVVAQGWMTPFGNMFKPNETVIRSEASGILVRMNALEVGTEEVEEIFSDVPAAHPAAAWIAAAVQVGFINVEEDLFYPDAPLDKETAVVWFSQVKEFRDEVSVLNNWNTGFGLETEIPVEDSWESQLIVDFADVQWTSEEENEGLKVVAPIDQSTVYDAYAIVKGLVKEAEFVTINGQKVKVDDKGAFVIAVPLDIGQNVIIVEAPKEKKVIRILREAVYDDVSRGEAGAKARMVGTLGLLGSDESFYPEQAMSRKELAAALVLLKEQKVAESSVVISDIDSDDSLLPYIKRAVDLKYFTLGENNSFNPNKEVTRGEAIAVINSFQGAKAPAGALKAKPFADVELDYPYAREIAVALESKLILQTENFYPDAPLTRKDFVDIIMNTQLMQERINTLRNWDAYNQENLNKPLKPKESKKKSSRVIDAPSSGHNADTGSPEDASGLLNFASPMSAQMKQGTIYPRTADQVGVGNQPLTVVSPKDFFITTQTDVAVAGIVKNNSSVLVNGNSVPVNNKGAFQTKAGLQVGKNTIVVEAGNDVTRRSVLRLNTYQDISNIGHKQVIEYLATLGYFGVSNTFQPNKFVTKEELIIIIAKMNNLKTTAVRTSEFNDVRAGQDSAPAIHAALAAGIIPKTANFSPGSAISRAEAAAFIARALQRNIPTGRLKEPPYSDVPATHPYANEIAVAKQLGIILADGAFNPDNQLTRSELAVWLVKTAPIKKQILDLRKF